MPVVRLRELHIYIYIYIMYVRTRVVYPTPVCFDPFRVVVVSLRDLQEHVPGATGLRARPTIAPRVYRSARLVPPAATAAAASVLLVVLAPPRRRARPAGPTARTRSLRCRRLDFRFSFFLSTTGRVDEMSDGLPKKTSRNAQAPISIHREQVKRYVMNTIRDTSV